MSRRMSKRRKSKIFDDSDNDDSPTPSQSKRTTNTKGHSDLIENLANDLVHYLIVADQKKIPVKVPDMKKIVLKENNGSFNEVLSLAKDKLLKNFDFDLQEVGGKRGSYMLINKLESNPDSPHLKWSEEELNKNGLLLVILACIFMNGQSISEDQLWSTLKRLGINPDTNHELFGDVKKLITREFKQQLYLDITKEIGTDPPTLYYRWGQRATAEVSKKSVLEFVCNIYGDGVTPEDWVQQYREAQEATATDE